jgi:hypothetical protein
MRLGVYAVAVGLLATFACGPAPHGTKTEAPNVELAPEPREDRHQRSFGEQQLVAFCDPELRKEVDVLFELVGQLHAQGAELKEGLRVHAGWTTLVLERAEGELVFAEPDYDATDPEAATRTEISASLRMLREQTEVLTRIGHRGEDVNFDQHVLMSRGALETPKVYLVRVASPGGRLTGWRIAPTDEQEGEMEVDSVPLHVVYKQRPALVRAMLLPVGYMAFFEGEDIEVIVDPQDQPIWSRAEPV